MAVFAVIARTDAEILKAALIEQYGAGHFEIAPNAWLVADDGSSKLVADKLGLTDGKIGSQGVVLSFAGYSGWGPAEGWAWLNNRPGVVSNG